MTRLAKWHMFAAGVFVGMILAMELIAQGSTPAPGWVETAPSAPSGVWQEITRDMRAVPIWEPRDPGPCGADRPCVGTGETPVPVPLPGGVWGIIAAFAALIWIGKRS